MRNEAINGYILHHKPYKEKQAIYYLLTPQKGIVHGICKKGLPLFIPLQMFASGKGTLKRLQQINMTSLVKPLTGYNQYAGLYVNEITLRLLPVEDAEPQLYQAYHAIIDQLRQPLDATTLRLALRQYEQCLFDELGFAIDFFQDAKGNQIVETAHYLFVPQAGFIKQTYDLNNPSKSIDRQDATSNTLSSYIVSTQSIIPQALLQQENQKILLGSDIIGMQQGIQVSNLTHWGALYRQLIDHLFEYKPLQSRILWQQFARFQLDE